MNALLGVFLPCLLVVNIHESPAPSFGCYTMASTVTNMTLGYFELFLVIVSILIIDTDFTCRGEN